MGYTQLYIPHYACVLYKDVFTQYRMLGPLLSPINFALNFTQFIQGKNDELHNYSTVLYIRVHTLGKDARPMHLYCHP